MVLDVREIMRRILAGQTDRAIARELGLARKTVARYRAMADQHGLATAPLLSPAALEQRLREAQAAAPPPRTPFKAEPYQAVIQSWRQQGVEMMAIFQRLRAEHAYTGSYSALHRYVRHLEPLTPEACVRLETPPGQEAQVDFGYAGRMVDPETGRLRKAWVFVMTLAASRHQYATFVFDQTLATWLRCHREAFEAFGGVPRRLVIDNLKAAIAKACLHDPVVQRGYRDFAEHYGFLIAPCRPRMAQHKGKVESGVHYIKRNFLAGRQFRDLREANRQLALWIAETAGQRRHGTTRQQPLVQFETVERAALLPLPATPYDMGLWKQLTLHRDCHVVLDGAYYSAPHRLIGQRLWIRSNGRDVWIFHDYVRVASHRWGPPGTRRTIRAHYPPEKAAVLEATPAACRERAGGIGPASAELVDALLAERPLDRLRTVQAILRLATRYGPHRLEAACRRALCYGDTAYATLKRILDKGLESEPLPGDDAAPPTGCHYAFARPGSEIFLTTGGTDHGA